MQNYYLFDTSETPDLAFVGGKAKALIETTAAGFPVPKGLVLSVAFFDPWFDIIEQTDAWREFLANSDDHHRCEAVKQTCYDSLGLSGYQWSEVNGALEQLGVPEIFAVRSSSPEEDLAGTSFAGGYETVLGVTRDTLEQEIRYCFTSMFDARIVQYKKQNGITIANPKIAIIIQQQIASETAGVAFSLNPLNNCYDEAVINANFGLGETVVSGTVTPDTFVVEKYEQKILTRQIAEKSHALWLEDNGGTREAANAEPKASSLNDAQILEVAQLAMKAESHYGRPMDLEWAFCEGELYLLQSRPITTYVPLFPEMITEPGEPKQIYLDLTILTQGFEEPLSTLGLDLWEMMLTATKGSMLPGGRDGALWSLHGRQYLLISNLARAFGGKMLKKILGTYDKPTRDIFDVLEPEMKSYTPTEKPEKLKGFFFKMMGAYLGYTPQFALAMINQEKAVQRYKDAAATVIATWNKELSKEGPFATQASNGMRRIEGIMKDVGVLMAPLYSKWRLGKVFANPKAEQIAAEEGVKIDDLLVELNMDLAGNPTAEMGSLMCQLASFEELQQCESADVFAKKIADRSFSDEFMGSYDNFVAKFGCRGMQEIDIASPRPCENPVEFFQQLKHINVESNATTNVKARREKAYSQLLAIAQKIGKEKTFKKHAEILHETWGYREHPKYLYVFLNNLLRQKALELGEKWTKLGRLEQKEQIFDLHLEQIALGEKNAELDLQALVAANLAPRNLVADVKHWPRVIDSRGKIIRPQHKTQPQEGVFEGDPISPGTVQGKAKVLNSPYEKPLEPGEILVTRATEPSWTPIFINASGVVLEVGGPLQHGAIIAREYGLPCVSGILDATDKIHDGDEIEVDGSSGVVRIIDSNACSQT